MPFFAPTLKSQLLRTRKTFFSAVTILHVIFTLVAALDVSGEVTKQSRVHVGASAFSLTIHLSSFLVFAMLTILDAMDEESSWRMSQTRFEVGIIISAAFLNMLNSIIYTALSKQFNCADGDICQNVNRGMIVGSWLVTVLHLLFAPWFTTTAFVAARHDPSVWTTSPRFFQWGVRPLPITNPSRPLDILGALPTIKQIDTKIRATWFDPRHDEGTSSPKLPPPPLPPKPTMTEYRGPTMTEYRGPPPPTFNNFSYPSQLGLALTPEFPEDVTDRDSLVANAGEARPITLASQSSRYSLPPALPPLPPPTVPLKLQGHNRGFSADTGARRYAPPLSRNGSARRVFTPQPSLGGRDGWLTPEATYGREYVDRSWTPSPQPSSPPSSSSASRTIVYPQVARMHYPTVRPAPAPQYRRGAI